MSMLEALVMGLIQGLTEFLPISSTAHLYVIPQLLGWSDRGASFTAVIQLGTLVAVIFYFREDIARLISAAWNDVSTLRFGSSHDGKMAWMIAAGTVPVVICGLAFSKWIKQDFRSLYVIAGAALGFALLLLFAEIIAHRRKRAGDSGRNEESIGWRDVLIVGVFQAFALIPGASRSGTTITGGLFAGLSRSTAARFSFLLSLPSVFAAAVKELYEERATLFSSQQNIIDLVVATVVSGIVGYASIAFLLHFLRHYSTYIFIGYRIIFGAGLLWLLQTGVLPR
jgi:undecaprenyl-diphosphatase